MQRNGSPSQKTLWRVLSCCRFCSCSFYFISTASPTLLLLQEVVVGEVPSVLTLLERREEGGKEQEGLLLLGSRRSWELVELKGAGGTG